MICLALIVTIATQTYGLCPGAGGKLDEKYPLGSPILVSFFTLNLKLIEVL